MKTLILAIFLGSLQPSVKILSVDNGKVILETRSGFPYVLEWSGDCKNWMPLVTVKNGDWSTIRQGYWSDYWHIGNRRFYRVRRIGPFFR